MFRRLPASLLPASLVGGALFLAVAGLAAPNVAIASQDNPAKPAKLASVKAPVKHVKKAAKAAPVALLAPELDVAEADEIQLIAAKEVYLGESGCEFDQKIKLDPNIKHPGYIDLSFDKKTYTMKPVLSATGALRLEDVRKETLMIQIASKTMLMNQKTGQRLVDNCVHPNQKTVTADNSQILMK